MNANRKRTFRMKIEKYKEIRQNRKQKKKNTVREDNYLFEGLSNAHNAIERRNKRVRARANFKHAVDKRRKKNKCT